MSFFQGANNIDPSSKLPFFPAGFNGEVQVDECKAFATRAGKRAFIVEFTVLSSNLTGEADVTKRVGLGARHSWYQGLDEPGTAFPACVAFLHAAMGLDASRDASKIAEIKPHLEKYLNTAVSDARPLKGAKMRLQTAVKKTKKGADFTLHTFAVAAS